MDIVVTGASGLIGSCLVPLLRAGGHSVLRLSRGPAKDEDEASWDPAAGQLDPAVLDGADAVVHLAGEPIGESRWTAEQKRRIHDSRVSGTRLLAEALAAHPRGPRILVTASGLIYGDRGEEILTEESAPGEGFLAQVCRDWEAAADPARDAGVRVAHLRTGIVLSPRGGALARLLPLARFGLASRMGSGRQWWPWITLDDVAGLYRFAVETDAAQGPLNATAPEPVTNAEFTRTLARVVHRPVFPVPVPRFGPALVLGRELAEELLFSSIRAVPARTSAIGYDFAHPQLEPALRDLLDPAGMEG